jgi:hypothetical protein
MARRGRCGEQGYLPFAMTMRQKSVSKRSEALRTLRIDCLTALYAFGDLKKLVPSVATLGAATDGPQVAQVIKGRLESVDPSVQLRAYRSRFVDRKDKPIKDETPIEEFCLLTYLLSEVDNEISSLSDQDVAEKAENTIANRYKTLKDLFERKVVKDSTDGSLEQGHIYINLLKVFPALSPQDS